MSRSKSDKNRTERGGPRCRARAGLDIVECVSCGGQRLGPRCRFCSAGASCRKGTRRCELLSPSGRWGGVRRDTAPLQRASGAHFSSDCESRSLNKRATGALSCCSFSDQWRQPFVLPSPPRDSRPSCREYLVQVKQKNGRPRSSVFNSLLQSSKCVIRAAAMRIADPFL